MRQTTLDKQLKFYSKLYDLRQQQVNQPSGYKLFNGALNNTVIQTNCKNCAAPLDYNFVKCLYCDTQFQIDSNLKNYENAIIKSKINIAPQVEIFIKENPQLILCSLGLFAIMHK